MKNLKKLILFIIFAIPCLCLAESRSPLPPNNFIFISFLCFLLGNFLIVSAIYSLYRYYKIKKNLNITEKYKPLKMKFFSMLIYLIGFSIAYFVLLFTFIILSLIFSIEISIVIISFLGVFLSLFFIIKLIKINKNKEKIKRFLIIKSTVCLIIGLFLFYLSITLGLKLFLLGEDEKNRPCDTMEFYSHCDLQEKDMLLRNKRKK